MKAEDTWHLEFESIGKHVQVNHFAYIGRSRFVKTQHNLTWLRGRKSIGHLRFCVSVVYLCVPMHCSGNINALTVPSCAEAQECAEKQHFIGAQPNRNAGGRQRPPTDSRGSTQTSH